MPISENVPVSILQGVFARYSGFLSHSKNRHIMFSIYSFVHRCEYECEWLFISICAAFGWQEYQRLKTPGLWSVGKKKNELKGIQRRRRVTVMAKTRNVIALSNRMWKMHHCSGLLANNYLNKRSLEYSEQKTHAHPCYGWVLTRSLWMS